ncbi:MAG: helix-turn-helix domain-containing protein [Acidobacteria bacterium]|nr:helix-turn-helix domain-containing protein [Acidobacteriota bacterium]
MSTQPDSILAAGPLSIEPYVDSKRAAEFLAFDSKTVQRLSRQGKIPAHPVLSGSRSLRRTWRYKLSELDEWARAQRNSATAGSATSPKEK